MNKRQKEKIEELTEDGKWNYVAKYGLSLGALMFFFSIFWNKFIMEYEIYPFTILLYLVIDGIGGLIIGLWGWRNINRKLGQ